MKKLLSVFLAVTLLMASFTAVNSADDITVLLDGSAIQFDVPPQIMNDRTIVPMRAVFEALGADVEWNGETRTVVSEKDGTVITMTIGRSTMYVNDDSVSLDVSPVIIGDRTLVPLRAIAESFDCVVDWEEASRTVIITTAVSPTPSPSPDPDATPSPSNDPDASPSPTPTASADSSSPSVNKSSDKSDTSQDAAATASPSNNTQTEQDISATPQPTEAPEDEDSNSEETDTNNDDTEEAIRPRNTNTEIFYDDVAEKQSSYANNFEFISIEKNEDGDYDITYSVQTYRDDSGNLAVTFNCYDGDGDLVDSFTELFHTWAYSWTEQEAAATVSGDTVRIELMLDK